MWMMDDFLCSPVLDLGNKSNMKSLCAAETPTSIFAVLPTVLSHGYQYIVLAHEKSANVGNMVWDKTGEDINHQWGKSFEAETLLNSYLREELIQNVSYFSILQNLYDLGIFQLLRRVERGAVGATHSCNMKKPWCEKCPKCSYVWLNYAAFLPKDLVDHIFQGHNLLDMPENQLWFQQMLGMGEHTPFECIGQIEETRLAFELCKRQGWTGRAMETYKTNFPNLDTASICDKFLRVGDPGTIPPAIAAKVKGFVDESVQMGLDSIKRLLQS
jgi:hypothetical protein